MSARFFTKPAKLKKIAINSLLLLVSLLICIILGEFFIRIFLNPVDYLAPRLIQDEVIKWHIEPYSAGYDAWGYRNESVPDSADIVTLGDSQTFGSNASAHNSWPAFLQRITNKNVYNLALGGYGPVQYSYLLENLAVTLNPSTIVVGLYYGNDIREAYSMVYNYEYWAHLADPEYIGKDFKPDDSMTDGQSVFLAPVRKWLANKSILYRLFTFTMAEKLRYLEMKLFRKSGQDIVMLDDPNSIIHTAFTPAKRLAVLNLDDYRTTEGLRISLDLFTRMNEFCTEWKISLVVALIPTKESVYTDYIFNNKKFKQSEVVDKLILNERSINKIIKKYFIQNSIDFVDLLEPLQKTIGKKRIYPSNSDGHPNRNGYEVIARTIHDHLAQR
ncbi:hypothetical protein CEE37_00595 [candidate division LCP-89 bacterium B3_LCP]|uniref:SGNH hydrolase-type esterase domain-containing protein n=1 Tax=candidate division LCP-89 bacterium B3_LCP TaxID=2012998 RepID=A0A532V4V6_UNCL8|nr:MAG: hypothetical protein CEE37_00595 [candidate division LCP-89 bacterium B3_LCP]